MATVIELRIVTHPNGGYRFYTVNKVFEGVGNVAYGQRKFMTYQDVTAWCKQEYPGVPVLRDPH